jgi:uncharacterized membrane protein YkvA (DUF1232 family)
MPNGADEQGREPALVEGIRPEPGDAGVLAPMWEVVKRLPRYAKVAGAMATDDRVPATAKAYLVAGGVYLVSPIDLIPGIIPVAGQIDDLYVVLTGLQQACRITPPTVVEAHFAAAGLRPGIVDEDLAAIRTFIRNGVAWSMRMGGELITRMSRQALAFARRAGQRGEPTNDQEPL